MQDKRLVRTGACELSLRNEKHCPVRIFANEQVQIEPGAVDELLSLLDCQDTLDRLKAQPEGCALDAVAVTPDFHKGAGIPIGTVLKTNGVVFPQAIGNDINCGMRLHTTSLDASGVARKLDDLETAARRIYFEGGRQIPMTGTDRQALLSGGLTSLFSESPWDRMDGLWRNIARQGWAGQIDRVEQRGSLAASVTDTFAGWIGRADSISYDDQIGSIGGGNHFVEIQRVENILDRKTAYAWGLRKGSVTVMVHSGSVGIGHMAGRTIRELLRSDYPRSISHPRNGIYPLGNQSPRSAHFWNLLHAAANFAFANRLFLAASAVDALERVMGDFEAPLLYDSPHNMLWKEAGGFIHRKGATPARGPDAMLGTPYQCWGEPVLVPGSMGTSSFVLAGLGNPGALNSASHGAGRSLSRGDARRSSAAEFDEFLRNFRVVTPLDLRRPDLRGRRDILRQKIEDLRAEGPHAYKGIRAIIETLEAARIARPVAELVPLATIKA